jgi:hypothetical protein
MDDKRVRQIHLLWRHRGSCTGPMAYSELAGMMSKALEQLQMFKSKVIKPVAARATVLPVFACVGPMCLSATHAAWLVHATGTEGLADRLTAGTCAAAGHALAA